MRVISERQHQLAVAALQQEIEDLKAALVAQAILLVRSAGGKIVVHPLTVLELNMRSTITEYHDEDGNRIFVTGEVPAKGEQH